jgi:hypothetical protein
MLALSLRSVAIAPLSILFISVPQKPQEMRENWFGYAVRVSFVSTLFRSEYLSLLYMFS